MTPKGKATPMRTPTSFPAGRLRAGLLTAALAAPLLFTGLAPQAPGKDRGLYVSTPESVGMSSERLGRINDVIDRYIAAHKISGAVTLVARRGTVVHHEARGVMDVETKAPMHTDSIFRMASCSKPVTGVAVMMLVEEGKIALTDPVSKYVPEFKGAKVAVEGPGETKTVPADREVTIHDLMTHTSGLMTGGPGQKLAPPETTRLGGSPTLTEGVAKYASVPLDYQPGTRWRYSGLAGIDTLARVVEVASGQTFDDFLKARVFGPLGMTDTGFTVPPDKQDRLAQVHRRVEDRMEKIPSYIRFPDTYYSGAGGLNSTAMDYARFAQMLCNDGELGGARLLSPRGVTLMRSNQVGDLFTGQAGRPPGMGFGLTVEVVTDPVRAGTFRSRGSYGWDGAFGTHFWVDPEERLIAVLLVQTSGRDLHRDFETAVLQSVVE